MFRKLCFFEIIFGIFGFFHVQSKHIKTFSFFCSCFVLNFTAWQPRLCESFMERSCRVSLLCDRAWSDPKLDAMYRSAAQAAKAWVFKKQTKKMGRFLKNFLERNPTALTPLVCFAAGGCPGGWHNPLHWLHEAWSSQPDQHQCFGRAGRAHFVQGPFPLLWSDFSPSLSLINLYLRLFRWLKTWIYFPCTLQKMA